MRRILRATLRYLIALFVAVVFVFVAYPVNAATYTAFFPATMSPASGRINSASTVWATARAGAGLTVIVNNSHLIGTSFYTPNYGVLRSFFTFNTIDLPDDAKITSARVCFTNTTAYVGSPVVYVVTSTRLDPLSLAANDWSTVGNIVVATMPTITNDYFRVCGAFSASYFSIVNKTGFSTIALRETKDLNNVTPTPTGNEQRTPYVSAYAADRDLRPMLEVTYESDSPDFNLVVNSSTSSASNVGDVNRDFFYGLISFIAGFAIMWLIL